MSQVKTRLPDHLVLVLLHQELAEPGLAVEPALVAGKRVVHPPRQEVGRRQAPKEPVIPPIELKVLARPLETNRTLEVVDGPVTVLIDDRLTILGAAFHGQTVPVPAMEALESRDQDGRTDVPHGRVSPGFEVELALCLVHHRPFLRITAFEHLLIIQTDHRQLRHGGARVDREGSPAPRSPAQNRR